MVMTANTDGKAKQHRTTMVREELLESLRQAEARVKAGQAIDYDRRSFRERLIAIYRGSKR
jgi:hypothetical protein